MAKAPSPLAAPLRTDHPVPTNFTSKIVSNGETSDVTMVLDEGSVKELAATPLPSSEPRTSDRG